MPDKAQSIAESLTKTTLLMGNGYLENSCFYQHLFNGNNVGRYLENADETIVKINRTLQQTDKPFSEILTNELSLLFLSINLDSPLNSWGVVYSGDEFTRKQ
ncbi:hypothetical protein [Xenorhabdus lircayensis]|uniref:Uncharacterized protein n=1 Tax=Xenorhabdus lircayensis TaxID=2763499 RepID=A0ABS0U3C5_9GAMM|nr:hypothetical protein [Xenorhabdus lircayensis]MBI6548396.1 hypothetical protein [Xenorhabdus lircayensis]